MSNRMNSPTTARSCRQRLHSHRITGRRSQTRRMMMHMMLSTVIAERSDSFHQVSHTLLWRHGIKSIINRIVAVSSSQSTGQRWKRRSWWWRWGTGGRVIAMVFQPGDGLATMGWGWWGGGARGWRWVGGGGIGGDGGDGVGGHWAGDTEKNKSLFSVWDILYQL